ncbi:MAG TPA: transglutaminase domain-containing protein [Candidatus Saccharimonadales bacterium]|nr:transglutaminase domain-containing protein [Candidatus Saccharimonadales bacterium]
MTSTSDMKNTRIKFDYPIRNNPTLAELREASGIKTDLTKSTLENAKNIIGYVHNLFSHDGDNTPSSNDPLTILKEAQVGKSFRCVEYSTLAAGLLWASDIPARAVGLKTRDVETREYGAGHL